MNSPFPDQDAFWLEIIDKHVLSPERVALHREAARSSPRLPLGKILIREGYLTVRQVMALVGMQADEPQVRIGDMAVREGMCTQEDIAHCLGLQSQSVPGPIEVVLRDENVSPDRLVNALVGYIHHLERRVILAEEAQQAVLLPSGA